MQENDFTDAQLILLFAHGREDAFDELYRRHSPGIYRFLQRMLKSSHEAEELLQETFYRVAKAAGRFEPGAAKVRTWIYRIASNCCFSYLKGRKGCKILPFPSEELREERTPESDSSREELNEALKEEVKALPPALQAAFVLREMEGFAYDEGARILEIPLGTFKTHVHRARSSLREKLLCLLRREGAMLSGRDGR